MVLFSRLESVTSIISPWAQQISFGCTYHFAYLDESSLLRMRHWRGTLSAVERLINPPGIVLRVKNNWVVRVGITHLVDLRGIAGADGEPIEVGVITDLLALVEISNQARAKDIAAEVDGNFLVEIDVVAVLLHTLNAGFIACLGGVSLSSVGSIGRPGEHWQRNRLGDRIEEQAIRYGHVRRDTGTSGEQAQCPQNERLHCRMIVGAKLGKRRM